MVRREDYLHREFLPMRDLDIWALAKQRQDDAIRENRIPNFVGTSYDHELYRNAVGLFGECDDMIWLNELYPGMAVQWLRFKEGDINALPDNLCGRPVHTTLDAKTNEVTWPTNFLILNQRALPRDGTRNHWIFTHHFIEKCEQLAEWKFRCPIMCTTGWCTGAEALAAVIPPENENWPVKGARNISQHHEVLKPMYELRRLIRLRERYGLTEGDERWKKGERI